MLTIQISLEPILLLEKLMINKTTLEIEILLITDLQH